MAAYAAEALLTMIKERACDFFLPALACSNRQGGAMMMVCGPFVSPTLRPDPGRTLPVMELPLCDLYVYSVLVRGEVSGDEPGSTMYSTRQVPVDLNEVGADQPVMNSRCRNVHRTVLFHGDLAFVCIEEAGRRNAFTESWN
jgi:hypothetical protein